MSASCIVFIMSSSVLCFCIIGCIEEPDVDVNPFHTRHHSLESSSFNSYIF